MEQGPFNEKPVAHPWKARLIVGIVILVLAFLGLIFTNLSHDNAWLLWRYITPLFAIICLVFTAYMRSKKHLLTTITIVHELFHWLGLFIAVFCISVLVDIGVIGKFPASLTVLAMLALTIYILGVYLDTTFALIAILLWVFTLLVAWLQVYIFIIIIPLTIIVLAIIFWLYYRKKHPSP